MRLRFSIRWLMLAVLLAALVIAAVVMTRRSADFRAQADIQAGYEGSSLSYANEARDVRGFEYRVMRGEQMARYHHALKLKYEQASRHPWLPVEPDPPVPE